MYLISNLERPEIGRRCEVIVKILLYTESRNSVSTQTRNVKLSEDVEN